MSEKWSEVLAWMEKQEAINKEIADRVASMEHEAYHAEGVVGMVKKLTEQVGALEWERKEKRREQDDERADS